VIQWAGIIKLGEIILRAFSQAIDRFCQKHRRFGIPKLMLFIVIASAVAFIFSDAALQFIAFDPILIMQGQVWRLVTWIFMPLVNHLIFLVIMLFLYYFIGTTLEREWGTGKFTIFYVFGVLLNIIYGIIMWFAFDMTAPLDPTFLNLSLFFAFATLFPDITFRLFFIIPVKVKWLALLSAGFFVFSIVSDLIQGHLLAAFLPVIAILNYILICGDDLLSYIRPMKARASPSVINFKKAAKQAKREQDAQPYQRKCAVCGRTDVDYPDLEFRFCSRCNGYHCFCIDHINNHIHFE